MQVKIDVTITAPEIADAILNLANAISRSQTQITSETQKTGDKMGNTNKSEAAPTNQMNPQAPYKPFAPNS